MHKSGSAADWPLVGRKEELDLLRDLRSAGRGGSAFISGPAGVGKSRIAREALVEAEREGWATLVIRGSAGFSALPLGPFRTVFQLPRSSDVTELTESVAHQLVAMQSSKGLLLLVDDCQDLDEFSSGLLHQVVTGGLIVAIITTRTGTHPPPALTDIWKDGFAERIELQNLSRLETIELLAAGLGASVQDSSANRIWNVTSGNPFYLREVVLSSEETGALKLVDGEWRWQGEWATGRRLQEIVAARLGRLDPEELMAMELLAVAGSLPLGLLTGLTSPQGVQRLEAHGLVTTELSGQRLEVTAAHPLHVEVLRSSMPTLQQRSMRRALVDALIATGARRTADRVRLACWSLESGLDVDPMTLALGTDASLFGIGRAIAGRLREIMPDGSLGPPPDGIAVPQDYDVAIRLARAAYERGGGLPEGVALASTLAWAGATADAESVLTELGGIAESIDDRIRVALGLAWVRFWGRFHVEEARAGLIDMAAEAESVGCDPTILAEIYQDLAGIALNTAQPAEALAYAERSAAAQGVELAQSISAPPAAAALAYLGRCGEAIALVDRAVPAARGSGHPLAVAQLLVARAAALARMGDLDQARQLMEWVREVALSDELLGATAAFGVVLGDILLRQGRPKSAARILRDSAGLLAEHDVFGYRPWALSDLARALTLSGNKQSAAALLDEGRRTHQVVRHFDMSLHLAEIELHQAMGQKGAAVDAARRGVAWARAAGMVGDEAHGLEAWLRVEPTPEVAERLAELTALTDSRLVGALAEYARAVVASDPASLLEVSERFAEMSAWWLAAEAAARATSVLDRQHKTRESKAAARKAAGFADHCEECAPRADDLSGSARLTKREQEIATLVAAGRSTKEMARELHLSPRTVENHLYHVYVKLGVTDRAALAAALAPAKPSE